MLADCGFDIANSAMFNFAQLSTPSLPEKKAQLSASECEEIRKIIISSIKCCQIKIVLFSS